MQSPVGPLFQAVLLLSGALADLDPAAGASGPRQSAADSTYYSQRAWRSEFPWQVSIRNELQEHLCGGALIEPDWVLTSAWCSALNTSIVAVGITDKTTFEHQYMFIDNTVVAPGNVDLALLQLQLPVTLDEDVGLVKLGVRTVIGGVNCRISGWGAGPPVPSEENELQKVNAVTYDSDVCAASLGKFSAATQFCALGLFDGRPSNVCTGCEGGPVVTYDFFLGEQVLQGIISETFPCPNSTPSVHTRVYEMTDWIHDTIGHDSANKAASLLGPLILAIAQMLAINI